MVGVEKAALPLQDELALQETSKHHGRIMSHQAPIPVVTAAVASIVAEAHRDVVARHTRQVTLAEARVREVTLEECASGTIRLAT